MNIIVLDDNPDRLKKFKDILDKHQVKMFKNSQTIIESFEKNNERIDYLFLDYDLGLYGAGNNGITVAKYLKEKKKNIGLIILHTSAPNGMETMYEILKDHYKVIMKPRIYNKDIFDQTFPNGL